LRSKRIGGHEFDLRGHVASSASLLWYHIGPEASVVSWLIKESRSYVTRIYFCGKFEILSVSHSHKFCTKRNGVYALLLGMQIVFWQVLAYTLVDHKAALLCLCRESARRRLSATVVVSGPISIANNAEMV